MVSGHDALLYAGTQGAGTLGAGATCTHALAAGLGWAGLARGSTRSRAWRGHRRTHHHGRHGIPITIPITVAGLASFIHPLALAHAEYEAPAAHPTVPGRWPPPLSPSRGGHHRPTETLAARTATTRYLTTLPSSVFPPLLNPIASGNHLSPWSTSPSTTASSTSPPSPLPTFSSSSSTGQSRSAEGTDRVDHHPVFPTTSPAMRFPTRPS